MEMGQCVRNFLLWTKVDIVIEGVPSARTAPVTNNSSPPIKPTISTWTEVRMPNIR